MSAGSSTPRDLARNRREPASKSPGPGSRRFLAAISLAAITLLSPASLHSWAYRSKSLVPVEHGASSQAHSSPSEADLDGDGAAERLDLASGVLTILSNGHPRWRTPPGWSVRQAAFTDLNRDATPEVSLLVWRDFQPWPTDSLLPHGGRIDGFHDADGRSCHLILVGWDRAGGYRELWAGSALAEPVTHFTAVDLDGDGDQELLTLENRYTDGGNAPHGRSLKVWAWDGFGFTAMDAIDREIARFAVTRSGGSWRIVAQVIR